MNFEPQISNQRRENVYSVKSRRVHTGSKFANEFDQKEY